MSFKTATFKLNNGVSIPSVGFGTYLIKGAKAIFDSVDAALKCGYRSFDTATAYNNEEEIGKAFKVLLPKYGLKREDIFLTTKLTPADHDPSKVGDAVSLSLKKLDTSYLDLYLVHWPGVAGKELDSPENAGVRLATWKELALLNKSGVLRSIGVSNYTIKHLQQLLDGDSGVVPAVNQVEFHPRFQQKELLKFCKAHGILLEAYFSLGGARTETILLKDEAVTSVASKLGRTPAQVLLRWALELGVVIIPKSVNPDRIAENFDLDFAIPEDCMTILNNIPPAKKYSWDPETVL